MTVRYTRHALAQLLEVHAYIAADRPAAAAAVVGRIREAIAGLTRFPHLGRQGREPGTRELVVRGTPFLVIYRARDDDVTILAIHHGARKWSFQPEG